MTIHGLFDDGWRVHLANGLLLGKTEHHYEVLPQSVMSDYERALMNAVEKTWPTTTRRGCFFHHKQALWKKMQHHDLVPEYNVENSPVRRAFQMIGAIESGPGSGQLLPLPSTLLGSGTNETL